MKKYYVEIYPKINNKIKEFSNDIYIFQSAFFDTLKEAEDYVSTIGYLNSNFDISIMNALGENDENGSFAYEDIDTEKKFKLVKHCESFGYNVSGYDSTGKLIVTFLAKSKAKAMKIYNNIDYSIISFRLIEFLD